MFKIIATDSQYNLFPLLVKELSAKRKNGGKTFIFCEEKISLMAERAVAREFGGATDTEILSFGTYAKRKEKSFNLLSKEGSSMAVYRVMKELPLKKIIGAKAGAAAAVSELIAQLKSSAVSPEDLKIAGESAKGMLKDKLGDLTRIYSAYEAFLSERDFFDQSAIMARLPDIIKRDEDLCGADVYVVGLASVTAQIKRAVKEILKVARSFTAIAVNGENSFAYTGEAVNAFRDIAGETGQSYSEAFVKADRPCAAEEIARGVFKPYRAAEKVKTDKIFYSCFKGVEEETLRIAETITALIRSGKHRYRDCTVAVPDEGEYKDALLSAFSALGVPCFFDEKKTVFSNPLVSFVLSYVDSYRKNFERETFKAFYKNPLISTDKDFLDEFENYVLTYNVNYDRFKKPFTFTPEGGDLEKLENFRKYVCSFFDIFDVNAAIEKADAKDKTQDFSLKLSDAGLYEESAVNAQIYDAVTGVLAEADEIIGAGALTPAEFRQTFINGVYALKLSILPQYNDAVFVGGYKECALVKSKFVFAPGLTSAVPGVKDDVAFLTDDDIDSLKDLKVLVEPKIKAVNRRTREGVALALSSFEKGLFVSYPAASLSGGKNVKSEVLAFITDKFDCMPFPRENGYMTEKEGEKTFARECGLFGEGKINDFTAASAFYAATDEKLKPVIELCNKEVKVRLNEHAELVTGAVVSPTSIEDFYKCPFRSFFTHGLKVRERKTLKSDALTAGNLMHAIFKEFVVKSRGVSSEEEAVKLFESVSESVLATDEYAALKLDGESGGILKRVLSECEKFCLKVYRFNKNSDFVTLDGDAEATFGKGGKYPPVPLLDGKINLAGKIDRIDTAGEYYRVIDYKTGAVDATDKSLFAGVKLQLYLYAAAVRGKKLAGAYYMPISDAFKAEGATPAAAVKGKTLADEKALCMQDKSCAGGGASEFNGAEISEGKIVGATDEETLRAFVKYALKASESAAREMDQGVIVPSPYGRVCENCPFSPVCGTNEELERTLGPVDEKVVAESAEVE